MSTPTPNKPHRSFGAADFLWRLVAALALVLVTFNPSGHSYIHWIKDAFSGEGLPAGSGRVGCQALLATT